MPDATAERGARRPFVAATKRSTAVGGDELGAVPGLRVLRCCRRRRLRPRELGFQLRSSGPRLGARRLPRESHERRGRLGGSQDVLRAGVASSACMQHRRCRAPPRGPGRGADAASVLDRLEAGGAVVEDVRRGRRPPTRRPVATAADAEKRVDRRAMAVLAGTAIDADDPVLERREVTVLRGDVDAAELDRLAVARVPRWERARSGRGCPGGGSVPLDGDVEDDEDGAGKSGGECAHEVAAAPRRRRRKRRSTTMSQPLSGTDSSLSGRASREPYSGASSSARATGAAGRRPPRPGAILDVSNVYGLATSPPRRLGRVPALARRNHARALVELLARARVDAERLRGAAPPLAGRGRDDAPSRPRRAGAPNRIGDHAPARGARASRATSEEGVSDGRPRLVREAHGSRPQEAPSETAVTHLRGRRRALHGPVLRSTSSATLGELLSRLPTTGRDCVIVRSIALRPS